MNPYGNPVPVQGYAIIPSNDKYIELAERRIAIVKRLTDAAFEYLTFSDRLTIETANDKVEPPAYTPYTLETLVKAQKHREQIQAQIEQMEAALDNMPDSKGGDAMAQMMDAIALAPLKQQLEGYDEYITMIQKELEGQSLKGGDAE